MHPKHTSPKRAVTCNNTINVVFSPENHLLSKVLENTKLWTEV